MYSKELYYRLVDVVNQNPEKFFRNISHYQGRYVAIFDYALTIPNDFGYSDALETRGSCFEVDHNGEFVSLLCLPYEKFFNPHELDYHGNDALADKLKERYGVECNSEYVMELANDPDTVVMEKRDGSIITFFHWLGKLDAKSNSSLTSDYKKEGMQLLERDKHFHTLVNDITHDGYSVMCEYTSDIPTRQIVIPYDRSELIVTGVRSHHDGSYMSHDDMVAYFGYDRVVKRVNTTVDVHSFNEEGIEGYVTWHLPSGFRSKIKTQWYLERHRVKESVLVPSNVWRMYINETLDDVVQHVPTSNMAYLEFFIDKCETLYHNIISQGFDLYDNHKHLDRKDFFSELKLKDSTEVYSLSFSLAKNLYLGKTRQDAIEHLKEQLLIDRKMSRLGIKEWSYNV